MNLKKKIDGQRVYKSVMRFGKKLKKELIIVRKAEKLGITGGVNRDDARLDGIAAMVLMVCPMVSNCLSCSSRGAAWLRATINPNPKTAK